MIYVSPSQINTSVECLRKWGYPRLDGVQVPQQRNAAVGERVHTILEGWLTKGIPPDPEERLVIEGVEFMPGRIAYAGIHHLPPPGPHLAIEQSFYFRHWTGRVDFAWMSLNGQYVMPVYRHAEGIIPGIGDHKTSGSKTFQYALDQDSIRTDPQGIVYANAALEAFPQAKEVDLLWNYYGQHKPHGSKKVHLRVHRDESRYRLEPLDALAEQLIRLRGSNLKAENLPANLDSCKKYGGCPHINYCPVSGVERLRSAMNNTNGQSMSLADQIQQATQQAGGALMTSTQVPVALEAPGEWQPHVTPGWEWNTRTREVRQVAPQIPTIPVAPPVITAPPMQVVAAPGLGTADVPPPMMYPQIVSQPTPPPVQAAPPIVSQPTPPPVAGYATAPVQPQGALPPIVMLGADGQPIGPDGQPFGSINAPEGLGQAPKAQPVAAASSSDDLDSMDKPSLVKLAASMGVDTKQLREKGIREKIRAARAAGVVPGVAVPSVPSAPALESSASVPVDDIFGTPLRNLVQSMLHSGAYTQWTAQQIVDHAKALNALLD